MIIPLEIAKELHEVPEEIIKEAAQHIGGENNFKKLLIQAKVFRHAGLKPIFLANKDASAFCVSSEETFKTRLH